MSGKTKADIKKQIKDEKEDYQDCLDGYKQGVAYFKKEYKK